MPTVTKQAAFEASAPTVWALVREFGKLDEWLPPVVGCETDGEGIGAVRTLTLGDGRWSWSGSRPMTTTAGP